MLPSARAEIVSSEEFSKILKQGMNSPRVSKVERALSKDELEEWLDVFEGKNNRSGS
jgi:hypothetical protein